MTSPFVPTLSVNLEALRGNYRLLKKRHAFGSCAAVVKADAYGLGMEAVSRALYDEGCRDFFVATLAEGIALRAVLTDAAISVFSGVFPGEENEFVHHSLTPVLGDISMIERWLSGPRFELPATLHVDTGMTRLGLSTSDLERLPEGINCQMVMSHLACANEPDHPKNAEQLARFRAALSKFPGVRASLANSSGMFLSPEYHFNLGRPGCALYGINPVEGENPMHHVATLSAPLLQVRQLDRDETVGYGASYPAAEGARIAIAAFGYADGYFRSLSNQFFAYIGGHRVPIAGRVSMDMIALDVSNIPESALGEQARVEFINEAQPVDTIAKAARTIGYEIFTRIGARVARQYT